MPSLDQILRSIEARLAELNNEMVALGAARSALEATSNTAPAQRTRSVRSDAEPPRRQTVRTASNVERDDTASPAGNGTGEGPGNVPATVIAATTGASSAEPEAAAATPRRVRRRPAKPEKPVEVLLADKLEAMLEQAPGGLSAITISKQANAGYNQVRDLLRELEASRHVRRTGTRRSSLWQLITEEEQIAERAAELARLSAAKSGDQPAS